MSHTDLLLRIVKSILSESASAYDSDICITQTHSSNCTVFNQSACLYVGMMFRQRSLVCQSWQMTQFQNLGFELWGELPDRHLCTKF